MTINCIAGMPEIAAAERYPHRNEKDNRGVLLLVGWDLEKQS